VCLFAVMSITPFDNLGVMTNNCGAVMNLLGDLLAVLGDNVLALLDVGGVHQSLAHRPGDLLGLVCGDLVAPLLHTIVALRAGGVAISLVSSLPLAVASMAVTSDASHNLGVMADNSGGVMHLCVDLLAVLSHDLLALLGVCCVNLNIELLVTFLPLLLDGLLLALPLHILLTLGSTGVTLDSGLSSSLGLSLSLAISVTMSDDMGVVANNSRAVVNLLVGLVALLGDDVLALLDVGGVHNCLADGPGHLTRVLLGHLVALLLHILVALGSSGVALVTGLSLSLAISVSMMTDDTGVVANNSGAVVNLLVGLMALLGDDVLALLDVGGVHDGVVLLVALLPLLLDGLLMTFLLHVLLTPGTRGVTSVAGLGLSLGLGHWGGEGGSSQQESGDHFVHHLALKFENIFPPTLERRS